MCAGVYACLPVSCSLSPVLDALPAAAGAAGTCLFLFLLLQTLIWLRNISNQAQQG